jgi:hypothetical protein
MPNRNSSCSDASSYRRAASTLGAARTDDRLRTIEVATDGSSHDAFLAVAWCAGILAVFIAGASWLFRHRTAA